MKIGLHEHDNEGRIIDHFYPEPWNTVRDLLWQLCETHGWRYLRSEFVFQRRVLDLNSTLEEEKLIDGSRIGVRQRYVRIRDRPGEVWLVCECHHGHVWETSVHCVRTVTLLKQEILCPCLICGEIEKVSRHIRIEGPAFFRVTRWSKDCNGEDVEMIDTDDEEIMVEVSPHIDGMRLAICWWC